MTFVETIQTFLQSQLKLYQDIENTFKERFGDLINTVKTIQSRDFPKSGYILPPGATQDENGRKPGLKCTCFTAFTPSF